MYSTLEPCIIVESRRMEIPSKCNSQVDSYIEHSIIPLKMLQKNLIQDSTSMKALNPPYHIYPPLASRGTIHPTGCGLHTAPNKPSIVAKPAQYRECALPFPYRTSQHSQPTNEGKSQPQKKGMKTEARKCRTPHHHGGKVHKAPFETEAALLPLLLILLYRTSLIKNFPCTFSFIDSGTGCI